MWAFCFLTIAIVAIGIEMSSLQKKVKDLQSYVDAISGKTPLKATDFMTSAAADSVPTPVATPTVKEAAKKYPDKIEDLIPQFAVRSNAPNAFRVIFKTWDSDRWEEGTNHFSTYADAEAVMKSSLADLKLKAAIWKPLYEKGNK